MRDEIESMCGRKASITPAMPLKTFPNPTPSPVIAGPTEACKSFLNVCHHGDLNPRDARSCRSPIAFAAFRANGVTPGSAAFSPFSARVKIGITAGCSDFDHADVASRRPVYAFNVARAAGVNFANSARYLACAIAAWSTLPAADKDADSICR